jgi:hypothetical protein
LKEFFIVCSLLMIIGFLVTPVLLIVILPMIVDPIDMDDEDVSIDSDTKEDERESIDDDNDDDDDLDERASF